MRWKISSLLGAGLVLAGYLLAEYAGRRAELERAEAVAYARTRGHMRGCTDAAAAARKEAAAGESE